MQTEAQERAVVAAPGLGPRTGRPRRRTRVAVAVGFTAIVAAAAGFLAADDDADDAPRDTPITQVIPFVTTPASGSGVSSADG